MAKVCSVCGKKEGKIYGLPNIYGKNICERHYAQFRRLGKIKDFTNRSSKDRNEIIEKDYWAEVILYKNNTEISKMLIDLDDVEKIKKVKWRENSNGYIIGKVNDKNILVHRYIKNPPFDMVIDHINLNKKDNRKENLRICTQQQNSFNRLAQKNNTSGKRGVYYNKQKKKWESSIIINGKRIYLGRYKEKEKAILVRERAEKEYYGNFAGSEQDMLDQLKK